MAKENTQALRTIDAIYLCPLNNIQGGHEVMNLATGNVVTRSRVWERLAMKMVIQVVCLRKRPLWRSQGFASEGPCEGKVQLLPFLSPSGCSWQSSNPDILEFPNVTLDTDD